tara:strand:- start:3464 stop:4018 length:555 start_codon:yes stop_codon:yes gene_type:complete
MAYVRPCKKCGQRISLREMKAKQWVAFDASTEKPHRCGYKNKADPNIKKLAKEKLKEKDSEGVDLGYSDIATDNLSEEQADEINSEINDIYEEASNVPPKVETKYKKEEVDTNNLKKQFQELKNEIDGEIQETEETVVQETKTYQNQTEDNKYKPRDIWWYVWRGIVIFWVIMFLNGILFGPFD